MAANVGIWIDHREAFLVRLEGATPSVEHLTSGAERQLRRSSDRKDGPFEADHVLADDIQMNIFNNDLQRYYDRVIEALGDFDGLWVLGPGEAKGEFVKRLEKQVRVGTRAVEVEASERMSEAQLKVAVVRHFQGASV